MAANKEEEPPELKGAARSFQNAAPYINIAYVLMASIAMMGVLGWWLDDQFSTRPMLTVFGIMSGLFLGFYHLFKVLQKLEKKKK
jgi:F0F1-type ATP synthase assembly protein I